MSKRCRWLMAAAAVAAVALIGTSRRVEACGGIGPFAINCDGIIIANQVTQIAHMVTQITNLVDQLSAVEAVQAVLTERGHNDSNMGRLREVEEQLYWQHTNGKGLSTSDVAPGAQGRFNQRVPGLSDEAGWLNILSAPRLGDRTCTGLGLVSCRQTVLLGGRPATETNPAEPSAFRSWSNPSGPAWSNPARNAARRAIRVLGDVAEGTATWRTVWNDIEAALPNAIRPADVRALDLGADLETRIIDEWRRSERRAGADLQHAHAIAEAASTLNAQVAETAAHLGELRDDDLMREDRLNQSLLANGVTQTELLLAQSQLLAQQQAAAARERYEREQRRREEQAEWRAEMAAGIADWQTRRADVLAQRAVRMAAHSRLPNPSTW